MAAPPARDVTIRGDPSGIPRLPPIRSTPDDAAAFAQTAQSPRPQQPVKKSVLLYGMLGGILIALLKLVEYRFLVVEHSVEIYGGLIAALFAALGIWLGLKLTRSHETVIVKEIAVPAEGPFVINAQRVESLRITPRELEILALIAAGLSNREIAERIFVSENTVKTHSSRLFDKLNARRRTQAVQIGKELGLIP